jgi:hypothetical protein
MASATYIGAGLDINPILLMPEVREFIYVDSQPKTEYGSMRPHGNRFYRQSFLPRLEKQLQTNNFTPIHRTKNYLEYANPSNKILKYYINTAFPSDFNQEIAQQISKSQHLIICGYDPDKSILTLMPNLKYIWMNEHTVYDTPDRQYESEEDMNNSTFRELRLQTGRYKYRLMKDNHEICDVDGPANFYKNKQ